MWPCKLRHLPTSVQGDLLRHSKKILESSWKKDCERGSGQNMRFTGEDGIHAITYKCFALYFSKRMLEHTKLSSIVIVANLLSTATSFYGFHHTRVGFHAFLVPRM